MVVAALLPWLAHAALGFADPEPDRRWRAAWRTALLLALGAAFVPGFWLFAVLAAAVVVGGGFISPRLLRDRDSWGPPVVALAAIPVLLAPWLRPAAHDRLRRRPAARGRPPPGRPGRRSSGCSPAGSATSARRGGWASSSPCSPFVALVPARTRVPVLVCWLVALAAAVVAAVLALVTLDLPAVTTRPSLGLFVVILQGAVVVAAVLGADAYLRRLADHHPVWQRGLAVALAVVAAVVPLGGMLWWLSAADARWRVDQEDSAVPAYMEQSSLLGPEHGVLVIRGSIEDGITYRIRRGDGITLGEDEILALADEDVDFTADVQALVSSPGARGRRGAGRQRGRVRRAPCARRRPHRRAARRHGRPRPGQRRGPLHPGLAGRPTARPRTRSTGATAGGVPRCWSSRRSPSSWLSSWPPRP